jgi:hypothetical protein
VPRPCNHLFLAARGIRRGERPQQDHRDIDINIPAGTISFSTPRPDAIPDMLKNLPNDVLYLMNPYGLELAFMIREAQAQARNGAQPNSADHEDAAGSVLPGQYPRQGAVERL